jgi:hypothetical protein
MLQLAALDEDDLKVVSAMVQDAVMTVGDARRLGGSAFSLAMNRYAWDAVTGRGVGERHRALLQFARVTSVETNGIDRARPDAILSLLAVRFEPVAAPSGHILLDFAGGASIRLGVECIECRLIDTGAAWAAIARPSHET